MQITSFAILMIGLIFDIMLILFVAISCLLIYSLLMINIETKTFDIGVMRLVGLSKGGFIVMIAVQAVMFVLPSVISAFASVLPVMWAIFSKLQGTKAEWSSQIIPDVGALL